MMTMSELQPSPIGEELAAGIVDDDDLQRELLAETIESGEGRLLEAGRTFCGVDAVDGEGKQPHDRNSRSVELQRCAVGEPSVIVHTHPTERGLQNPQHSLPDLANVAFEGVDASVIVGAETSSIVYSATDPEAQQAAFRNALGVDVDSTADVIDAYEDGRIGDAAVARRHVVDAYGPLVDTARTSHSDLAAEIPDSVTATDTGGLKMYYTVPFGSEPVDSVSPADSSVGRLREQGRIGAGVLRQITPSKEVKDTAIGTLVGMLTSRVVKALL